MDSGSPLTVDHFKPRAQGGTHSVDNLVYCRHACNENKGDWWNPNGIERVLHPLNDDISQHISQTRDGILIGLTRTGVFHIGLLRLNRPPLVSYRRRHYQMDQDSEGLREMLHIVRDMNARMASVENAIEELRRGGE